MREKIFQIIEVSDGTSRASATVIERCKYQKPPSAVRAGLDKSISGGYTGNRKGAAGRRLAPISYKK